MLLHYLQFQLVMVDGVDDRGSRCNHVIFTLINYDRDDDEGIMMRKMVMVVLMVIAEVAVCGERVYSSV